MAEYGIVIVSGLAYGIDSCAHRGCLDAGGTTIAVLGTPIDQVYPVSNTTLARRILEDGAIISEYEPGKEIHRYYFLHRNRIVTALADAVIIVEASMKSGTLYTADASESQGRKTYVVPGDITRPSSAGCNYLIMNGAYICTSVQDVLLGLGIKHHSKPEDKYSECSAAERMIVRILESGETSMVDMIAEAKYSVSQLMQVLTQLELRGLVKNTGNDSWILV